MDRFVCFVDEMLTARTNRGNVMPVQTGIHMEKMHKFRDLTQVDSRFRGNDKSQREIKLFDLLSVKYTIPSLIISPAMMRDGRLRFV